MIKYERDIPENTYILTNSEIRVIHAMALYFTSGDSGMADGAQGVCDRLEKQFRMHEAIGKINVWDG